MPAQAINAPAQLFTKARSPIRVDVMRRVELARLPHWATAFAGCRKDHRYYELVEDTLDQRFEHGCFVLRDAHMEVAGVQPFFLLDQDLAQAVPARPRAIIETMRRVWPRFLVARTLMVGCAAGEGRVEGDPSTHHATATCLAAGIVEQAGRLGARVIVLKEFPSRYRDALSCFFEHGFSRIPSMPMTKLNIDYGDFEDYARKALNSSTRRKLRKKFGAAARARPIQMTLVDDITPFIDEIYPLYQQVYDRSRLRFEHLTPAYFCEIGRRMSDKASFFVWRQDGRVIAFCLGMFEGDSFYPEYVGFDYAVALEAHLYHYIVRDMISWAIDHGYKWLRSSALNYDPKLHLRHTLDPVDLYVRHVSPTINAALKWLLPWIEPTRYDPVLRKFPNYSELWGPD